MEGTYDLLSADGSLSSSADGGTHLLQLLGVHSIGFGPIRCIQSQNTSEKSRRSKTILIHFLELHLQNCETMSPITIFRYSILQQFRVDIGRQSPLKSETAPPK